MNDYILKVMRYMDNPELFTCEEMEQNSKNALAVYDSSFHAEYGYDAFLATQADVLAIKYATARTAAYATSLATVKHLVLYAEFWMNIYFKNTGENKENYIKEVERLK
mgnify:CR=1 FL=1